MISLHQRRLASSRQPSLVMISPSRYTCRPFLMKDMRVTCASHVTCMYDPNLSPGIRLSTDTYTNPQLPCTVPPRAVRHHLRYKYKPNVKRHRIWQQNNLAKFQDLQSKWLVGHEIHSYHADQASTVEKTKVSSHTDTQYICSKVKCERLMQLSMVKAVDLLACATAWHT